jgi:peptide chain release factor 1
MPLLEAKDYRLNDKDIEIILTKDSGPGGQHRNKTESCVIMRHKPTGMQAKAATRCQHKNKVLARQVLEARVSAHLSEIDAKKTAGNRKAQVGSGMRGDKVRTYRVRDNLVCDHRSEKKVQLGKIREGCIELLV